MSVKNFEDLEIWKKARELTKTIYRLTARGAFAKDYGLRDQIRRAAVSIMSNIAEGYERGGNQELMQFLAIAKGSCGEVRCQLYVALDQGYIEEQAAPCFIDSCRKVSIMIYNLMEHLKTSRYRGQKYKAPKRNPKRDELDALLQKHLRK